MMNGFISLRRMDHNRRRLIARKRGEDETLIKDAETPIDIWHLPPPVEEFGTAVTLVNLKDNASQGRGVYLLINCGASDRAVSKYLVPALRGIGVKMDDIRYLLFTDCSPESSGGVHKVCQLAHNITVLTSGAQAEYLKNPSYRFMKKWEDYLDDSPPYRELSGMIPDGTVAGHWTDSRLEPYRLQGYSVDSVCWYCKAWNLFVCGGQVQGRGSKKTGIAIIESQVSYIESLDRLLNESPEYLLLGAKPKDQPYIVSGFIECKKAINASRDVIAEYNKYATSYAQKNGVKKENIDIELLTEEYFKYTREKPFRKGYAMRTFDFLLHPKKYKQKFASECAKNASQNS